MELANQVRIHLELRQQPGAVGHPGVGRARSRNAERAGRIVDNGFITNGLVACIADLHSVRGRTVLRNGRAIFLHDVLKGGLLQLRELDAEYLHTVYTADTLCADTGRAFQEVILALLELKGGRSNSAFAVGHRERVGVLNNGYQDSLGRLIGDSDVVPDRVLRIRGNDSEELRAGEGAAKRQGRYAHVENADRERGAHRQDHVRKPQGVVGVLIVVPDSSLIGREDGLRCNRVLNGKTGHRERAEVIDGVRHGRVRDRGVDRERKLYQYAGDSLNLSGIAVQVDLTDVLGLAAIPDDRNLGGREARNVSDLCLGIGGSRGKQHHGNHHKPLPKICHFLLLSGIRI